jgi:peptidylprolyl isomerase
MTLDNQSIGRIVMELFTTVTPKTCQNFKALCAGTESSESFGTLTFKGSLFHRIIKVRKMKSFLKIFF